MEHYEIKSINDAKKTNENLPREGLVTEVCRGWLMHEDQALAYRLQSEEYQHHLGHNRHRNALLRKDTPRAREEQLREDEEAARVQMQLEMELAEQERRDAEIAAAIGNQLDKEEQDRKRFQEMKDRQLAKKLIEEEKTKVRQVKELRQVEREAAYLGINSGLDNVAILSRKDKRSALPIVIDEPQNRRAVSPNSDDLSDLSDFCIQPSSSMDEDEMKKLQENQDEELARLLQEQDLKRRGDLLQEDQLSAIEAQDKELAKILQEQEKAKAKKAREKARQKALLKQQQQHQQQRQPQSYEQEQLEQGSPPPRPPKPMTPPLRESSPNLGESPQYAAILPPHRPNSPQYATPMLVRGTTNSSSSFGDSPTRNSNERSIPAGEGAPSYTSSSLAFQNIACAIDPTYERRVKQGELSPSTTLTSPNRLASPPGSSKSHVSPPVFEEEEEEDEDEDDYLPPPYMPIQGQRRTASLEKRVSPKPPKEKPTKNGCKQQ